MEDIVKLFNPANAEALTEEQLSSLQGLTYEELKQLAQAYPNQASGNTYLVLKDKTVGDGKQLNPVSTWANLFNLHKIGQTQFVAAGFSKNFKKPKEVKQGPVQDLTSEEANQELANLKAPVETAPVQKLEPIQGGDIAGNGQTNTKAEDPAKVSTAKTTVEDFDDEVPLNELSKAGLQEKYEGAFGVKPKDLWPKQQLIDAIQKAKPIE